MKHQLIYIGSALVLFALTSCAQLPAAGTVATATRCPIDPNIQMLDPEKFDLGTLPAGCHPDE